MLLFNLKVLKFVEARNKSKPTKNYSMFKFFGLFQLVQETIGPKKT
jgi:hypothetical protein